MTPEEFARREAADPGDRGRAPAAADAAAAPRLEAAARSTCAGSCARRSRPAASRSSERFRSRAAAPRKLVLILDVSGSMEAYARALLLYLHAARGSGRGVETFAFGTRLTRLTPELGARDPEAALEAAAARVQSTGRAARGSARR